MLKAEIHENSDKFKKNKREILKTTKIKCTNCGTTLGECIETKRVRSLPAKQKHIFFCPCGGESFVFKTENDAFFHSEPEFIVIDMTHDKDTFSTKLGKSNETSNTDITQ